MIIPYLTALKWAGLAAICGAFFYAGWRAHPAPAPLLVTESAVVVAKETAHQVAKATTHVVKQKVQKPDGTTTTTTTTDVVAEKVADKTAQTETHTQTTVAAPAQPQPNWSVGVKWRPSLSDLSYKPQSAEIGRRVVGDVWVTGEYDWKLKAAAVGVRAEF